jgi:hypothetical protein
MKIYDAAIYSFSFRLNSAAKRGYSQYAEAMKSLKMMIAALAIIAASRSLSQAFVAAPIGVTVDSVVILHANECESGVAPRIITPPPPAWLGPIFPATVAIGTVNIDQLSASVNGQPIPVSLQTGGVNSLWLVRFLSRPAPAGTTIPLLLTGYRCGDIAATVTLPTLVQ